MSAHDLISSLLFLKPTFFGQKVPMLNSPQIMTDYSILNLPGPMYVLYPTITLPIYGEKLRNRRSRFLDLA